MAFALQDYEDPTQRQVVEIEYARIYTRTFRIPMGDDAGLLPTWGEAVLLRDVTAPANAMFYPRCMAAPEVQDAGQAMKLVTVRFIEPITYSAAGGTDFEELRGSGVISATGSARIATRIGVSLSLTSGVIPDRGDNYPGESGLLAMQCLSVQTDKTTLPGLWFVRAEYGILRSYLGG